MFCWCYSVATRSPDGTRCDSARHLASGWRSATEGDGKHEINEKIDAADGEPGKITWDGGGLSAPISLSDHLFLERA